MSQPWLSPPARFLSGVSTQQRKSLLGSFPMPNPACANVYFNDFNTYAAADWTVTSTNSGTSALQIANGGSLLLTTGGTGTNYQGNTLVPASFAITPGYRAWFAANITMSIAAVTAAPSFILGLVKGTVATPSDGIYFTYAGGTATTVSAVIKAAAASTSTITGIATPVAATAFTLGWFYDGLPTPTLYFYSSTGVTNTAFTSPPTTGGVMVAAASDGAGYAAPNVLTNLPGPTIVMAPQIYMVQPTTTTAPTISVDWMLAAAELARN